MKAWIVSNDEFGTVVFADTPGKAKMKALADDDFSGGELEFMDVNARRFKEMDGRENNPPTDWELFYNYNWWFYCEGNCMSEMHYTDEYGIRANAVEINGKVYCKTCAEKMKEKTNNVWKKIEKNRAY